VAGATVGRMERVPLVQRVDADGVSTLTLNRPDQRNALSLALMVELIDHLHDVGADRDMHVVVLAGNGPAFSAGHDLRELRDNPDPGFRKELFDRCAELMLTIVHHRQPVIAKVHGVATAAGCQLVATCDLAVASVAAKFATPGVNIGLFCSTPMVALSRAVPAKPAMEMLLTGEMIDAATAAAIGLVNRAVPDDQLDASVAGLARTIAEKSPLVLSIGKEAFHRQRELPLAEAYAYTAEVMVRNLEAADATEGIAAFLDKRPPTWRGC
jgi:enoyl-CoA hydratase/carnithine racemase